MKIAKINLLSWPFLFLFFSAVTFPIGIFFLMSFQYLKNSQLNLADLFTPALWVACSNSFIIGVCVATLSLVVALPLSWLLARSDLPFRQTLRQLLILPFVIPPFLGAMAWIQLANPTNGYLNLVVGNSFFNIYSYTGIIFVEMSFLYSIVLINLLVVLDRFDTSLEEAARICGASPFRVYLDVTWPLIKRTVMGSTVIVFLATTASFGVPAFLGNPANIFVLTTQIYLNQKTGTLLGIAKSSLLGALLAMAAIVLLSLNYLFFNQNAMATISGKATRTIQIKLGRARNFVLLAIVLFIFLVLALPLFATLISALSEVPGKLEWANLSLSNFRQIFFETSETYRAFLNSFKAAILASTIGVILCLGLGFIRWKTSVPGRNLTDFFLNLPFSLPGSIIALSLIFTFSQSSMSQFGIYDSLSILIVAYVLKYSALSFRSISDGINQIHPSLIEASRVCGANNLNTFIRIWLPLLAPALMASWILIFLPTVSELTMSVLLAGPGQETLGTLIFQMQNYSDLGGGGSSVLSLFLIFLILLFVIVLRRFFKERVQL